jgi:hypothetical protein
MRRLLLATFLLLMLVPAGIAAAADRPSDLLVDACRDEKVDGSYSQRTYRRALDQLPADSDQYTGCRDVINRARLAALSKRKTDSGGGSGEAGGSAGSTGSSSGGGGGSTGGGGDTGGGDSGADASGGGAETPAGPTDAELRAQQDATRAGAQPVRVGGQLLRPGAVSQVSDETRRLPTPLIVLLAVLAVCALAAAGTATWSRVHARRLG